MNEIQSCRVPENERVDQGYTVTADELRRLYAYELATDIITRMLEKGLINLGEFNKIDSKNIRSFSPPHAGLLPNYS